MKLMKKGISKSILVLVMVISLVFNTLPSALAAGEATTFTVETKSITSSATEQIVSINIGMTAPVPAGTIKTLKLALVYDDAKVTPISTVMHSQWLGGITNSAYIVPVTPISPNSGKMAVYFSYTNATGIATGNLTPGTNNIGTVEFKVPAGTATGDLNLVIDQVQTKTGAAASNLMTISFTDGKITVSADKADLQAAITDAGTKTEAAYTAASWTAMQTALTAANIVNTNAAATIAEVSAATTDLINAIAALVEKLVADTVKPVITLNGLGTVTIPVGSIYADAGASASDNIDGDITSSIVITNPVDTTTAGDYTVRYNVTDSSGNVADEVTRQVHVVEVNTQFKAEPVVRIGVNPDYDDSLGLFIGLENIKDQTGNLIDNPNIAGYQIEVSFDPTKVAVLDVVYEANLGQFISHVDTVAGKLYIADAAINGTTSFNKLFFLPITLIGSALDSTSISVKYIKVVDTNLNQIGVENPLDLVFHRGKIVNEGPGIQPSISDAIAGLQYLAGLRSAGSEANQINPINMASIQEQNAGSTVVKPSVKDVIALLQYLVNLRDPYFNLVTN